MTGIETGARKECAGAGRGQTIGRGPWGIPVRCILLFGCVSIGLAVGRTALAEDFGGWTRNEISSGPDAPGISFAATSATQDLSPGGQMNGVVFFAECRAGKTSAGLRLLGPAQDTSLPVTVAVDLLSPTQQTWTVSERSAMMVGLWDSDAAVEFLGGLVGTQRLTLQLAPRGQVSTYTYKTETFAVYAAEIAAVCGWSLR